MGKGDRAKREREGREWREGEGAMEGEREIAT